MKEMDLSLIQKKRDRMLRKKYKQLGLNSKAIRYREYQRKYYEIMKAKRMKKQPDHADENDQDKSLSSVNSSDSDQSDSSRSSESDSSITSSSISNTSSAMIRKRPQNGIIVIDEDEQKINVKTVNKRLKIDINTGQSDKIEKEKKFNSSQNKQKLILSLDFGETDTNQVNENNEANNAFQKNQFIHKRKKQVLSIFTGGFKGNEDKSSGRPSA